MRHPAAPPERTVYQGALVYTAVREHARARKIAHRPVDVKACTEAADEALAQLADICRLVSVGMWPNRMA